MLLYATQCSCRASRPAPAASSISGWFYILTYLTLLLVSINAVVFILASQRRIIQHEDNLISKLLYLPVLTFALLVITVAVFV